MKTKISVICPFYLNEGYIEHTIDSILWQSYRNIELICVLNGYSKKNEYLKSKYDDDRIIFLEYKENQGSYWGVEYGIQKATGKYIAFIGSDDYWSDDKLEKQLNAFEQTSDIGAVFYEPTLVNQNNEIINIDGLFCKAETFNGNRFHELHHFFYNMNGLCWSSALIEKALLQKSSWKIGRFKQLCDKKHWINCLSQKRILVLPDKNKVFYRIHTNNECLTNIDKVHNRVILENCYLLKDYLNFSPSELNMIFEKELHEENLNFTEDNKLFIFARMCKKKTSNPIVNKSLNFLGSQLWFEGFAKERFYDFQKESKMSNNQMLDFFIPDCFDVNIGSPHSSVAFSEIGIKSTFKMLVKKCIQKFFPRNKQKLTHL